MSFNVRHGTAEDGANHWRFRKAFALQLIQDTSADIIGLQEVLEFQLHEIAEALPNYGWIGVGREDGLSDGEFAPIFFRKDKFEVIDSGTFWLSTTPDVPGSKSWNTACTRICSWVDLSGGALKITVFNLHTDHESAEAREQGIREVLNRVGQEISVVMGDFNAGEGSAPIQKILDYGLIDTFREAHPEDQDVYTFHGYDDNPETKEKIDYIFVSPSLKTVEAAILRQKDGDLFASDHYPVTAVVTYRKSS